MDAKAMWCAGFFQGEGYFGLGWTKRKHLEDYRYPVVKITQYYDRTPLDRFQEYVGCGTVNGPHKNEYTDQFYQYNASNKDAIYVARYIWPHLTGKKFSQIADVMDYYADYLEKERILVVPAKTHCPQGHSYAECGKKNPYGYMICKSCHADQKRKLRVKKRMVVQDDE